MRTPRESAWGNFSGKKQLFVRTSDWYGKWLLVGQETFETLKQNRYGDHVTSIAAIVDAESWGEYDTVAHLAA